MALIEVRNIRKEFGSLVAVNDVSFSVNQGDVVGLIGPNGAGKTTLLRMLATILPATDGEASLAEFDIRTEYLKVRKHIGYLPDFFNLYNNLKLEECLEFFGISYGVDSKEIKERIDNALKFVELEEKRKDFISHLSRGMIQRMGVAVLLVHNPAIYLLDEPASGLDPNARIKLRGILKKLSGEGKTIIISSHILTELKGLCSHLAIMNKGSILKYGTVEKIEQEVFGSQKVIISLLGQGQTAGEYMQELEGVSVVLAEEKKIIVETAGGEEKMAQINKHLIDKGIAVTGLSQQSGDIENIFMEITGKENQLEQEGV